MFKFVTVLLVTSFLAIPTVIAETKHEASCRRIHELCLKDCVYHYKDSELVACRKGCELAYERCKNEQGYCKG